jgi:hypothetical protein
MSGPARGRRGRVDVLRAALPCLALLAFGDAPAAAQTITPNLFRPVRDGFVLPQDSPLRRVGDKPGDKISDPVDPANDTTLRDGNTPAPSRIGQIPTYGLPAANGASTSGFDSLSGSIQAETAAGSRHARASDLGAARDVERPRAAVGAAIRDRQQAADPGGDGGHGGRPAAAQAAQGR